MKLIDVSRPEEQMDSLSALNAGTDAWQVADVTLTDLASGNIVMLGRRLEKALKDMDGAILVASVDKLKVFFKDGAPDFNAPCSGLAFTVSSAPATKEQIGQLADRIAKSLQGYHKAPPKSALFEHRKKRTKNVVMVADDDLMICAAMKTALGRYGECVVVHNANEVLDAYVDCAPDSVFLDLHLEGGTGLDGLDAIIAYDRDAYIVMLTGDSTASHAAAAKKSGAKSFLSKPIVLTRLEYELFQCPTFRRYA